MINRGCLSQAGPDGETLYPVDGSIFIGSASDSDVRVKDAAPRQCQVVRTAEGYVLIDLTGQRVTRVNGTRIERHLLQSGEAVTIGSAEFRWTVTAEPEEEEVLVVASSPVRRRPATARTPAPAPASPKSRAIWIGSAVAAGAVVLIAVLAFAFSSSSNADRSISRRGLRPARSELTTPS